MKAMKANEEGIVVTGSWVNEGHTMTFMILEDDTIKVSDASYENGLLSIYLEREIPDHQKPRKIEINNKSFKKIN